MSTTDQFPPRHLLPEEEEEGEQGKTQDRQKGDDAPTATTSQGTHDEETTKQPQLALPAPSSSNGASSTTNDDASRSLNVATGNRVALDELGPMVVNPNGTLSRIHNWSEMIPSERERTLRVLGARNKLRMDNIRGQESEGEQRSK